MGWGNALFLGDIGNQLDIQELERDVERLRELQDADADVDRAQTRHIRQLELYLASLVRPLVRKGVVSRDELSTLVELIDK